MTMRLLRILICSLALAAALPATAAPRIVLDYRKGGSDRPPAVSAQTRKLLADAMQATAQTTTMVVLGHVRTRISASAGMADVYLVADKAPIAAEPFPLGPGQLLVAVADGRASVHRLPAERRYQRIAGTVDADRDGRGEVLLEGAFYNMGQSVTSLDLVALGDDGAASVRQSLNEVASDSCDNRGGTRERWASSIVLGDDGKLVATPHRQRCG